jgi:hypothetical protein
MCAFPPSGADHGDRDLLCLHPGSCRLGLIQPGELQEKFHSMKAPQPPRHNLKDHIKSPSFHLLFMLIFVFPLLAWALQGASTGCPEVSLCGHEHSGAQVPG